MMPVVVLLGVNSTSDAAAGCADLPPAAMGATGREDVAGGALGVSRRLPTVWLGDRRPRTALLLASGGLGHPSGWEKPIGKR